MSSRRFSVCIVLAVIGLYNVICLTYETCSFQNISRAQGFFQLLCCSILGQGRLLLQGFMGQIFVVIGRLNMFTCIVVVVVLKRVWSMDYQQVIKALKMKMYVS